MSKIYTDYTYQFLSDKKTRDLLDKYSPGQDKVPLSVALDMALSGAGVPGKWWFVDINKSANGNGALSSPFNNIPSANGASSSGDTIYVFGHGATLAGLPLKADRYYNFNLNFIYLTQPVTFDGKGLIMVEKAFFICDGLTNGFINLTDGQTLFFYLSRIFTVGPTTLTAPFFSIHGVQSGSWGCQMNFQDSAADLTTADGTLFDIGREGKIEAYGSSTNFYIKNGGVIRASGDSEVSIGKIGSLGNSSDTIPTIYLTERVQFHMDDGAVIRNNGIAPTLYLEGNDLFVSLGMGSQISSNGLNSLVKTGSSYLQLSPFGLGGDFGALANTSGIYPIGGSVILPVAANPNNTIYGIPGTIAQLPSPTGTRYICRGNTIWQQLT